MRTDSESRPSIAPSLMAEYEFLRPPLGRGAFGVTFKARKRGADAIVAIKRSTRGTDDEATSAIREAIHLLLDHRNLGQGTGRFPRS